MQTAEQALDSEELVTRKFSIGSFKHSIPVRLTFPQGESINVFSLAAANDRLPEEGSPARSGNPEDCLWVPAWTHNMECAINDRVTGLEKKYSTIFTRDQVEKRIKNAFQIYAEKCRLSVDFI